MTIGSPRRFFSKSRGRVIGRRDASAGAWMFGWALMLVFSLPAFRWR
jgi:hypothetical protein